jgi:hypothetical protein
LSLNMHSQQSMNYTHSAAKGDVASAAIPVSISATAAQWRTGQHTAVDRVRAHWGAHPHRRDCRCEAASHPALWTTPVTGGGTAVHRGWGGALVTRPHRRVHEAYACSQTPRSAERASQRRHIMRCARPPLPAGLAAPANVRAIPTGRTCHIITASVDVRMVTITRYVHSTVAPLAGPGTLWSTHPGSQLAFFPSQAGLIERYQAVGWRSAIRQGARTADLGARVLTEQPGPPG